MFPNINYRRQNPSHATSVGEVDAAGALLR